MAVSYPTPIHLQTAIIEVIANGASENDATEIEAGRGWTVVVARKYSASSVQYRAVKLPADAEIGDVIEIHASNRVGFDSAPQLIVFPPSGETVNDGVQTAEAVVDGNGRLFRKVAAANWLTVGSYS